MRSERIRTSKAAATPKFGEVGTREFNAAIGVPNFDDQRVYLVVTPDVDDWIAVNGNRFRTSIAPKRDLDCGYVDQPHFANEFRALAGMNPTRYLARLRLHRNRVVADAAICKALNG